MTPVAADRPHAFQHGSRRTKKGTAIRGVLLVASAVVLLDATVAQAAGRTTTSKKLGSGVIAVASCGTLSGVTLAYRVAAGNVAAVTLSAIPSTCNGATLSITLTGSGSSDVAHANALTISGTTLTVSTLSASPAATAVTGASISVVGP